jgi:hypothetical protein
MRNYFGFKWLNRIASFVLLMTILLGLTQEYAQGQNDNWSIPINFSQQPDTYSSVPNILCDRYQNLHVFWGERLEQNGYPLSILFYKNNVRGRWSQPLDLLITTRFEEVHSAITPDNKIHLFWSNSNQEVMYFRAPLGSTQVRQWGNPIVLESGAIDSNVFVDKDGILYVIYTTVDKDAIKQGIYYISSADSGETWSLSKTILETSTPVPSSTKAQIVVDGQSRFHVVYTIRSFNYRDYSSLEYMRSIDSGENWERPITFPPTTTFQGVNLLAEYSFGDDEIHLTYDIPERLHQWSYDGGESWSQPIPIVNGVELGAAFGGFNQLVKDGSSTIHVVFAESRGVFHSTWNGADWSTAELIDSPSFDPHGQTMALCQGNQLSVLYSGNDEKSEIWYSEKLLNIPSIHQSPIPTPKSTPTPIPTPVENLNIIESPIPTKIVVNQPIFQENQSLLSVIILPVFLVIILISAAFYFRLKQP